MQKLRSGDFDAIVLAKAGLDRLGWTDQITEILPESIMLPAVGQGALALEIREDDQRVRALLRPLDHEATRLAVCGERAFMKALNGGCHLPMGALGRVEDGTLWLEGCVISPDGSRLIRDRVSGPAERSEELGRELARSLLALGAGQIMTGEGIRNP
jgi:hydroxymethylbilane synthase